MASSNRETRCGRITLIILCRLRALINCLSRLVGIRRIARLLGGWSNKSLVFRRNIALYIYVAERLLPSAHYMPCRRERAYLSHLRHVLGFIM